MKIVRWVVLGVVVWPVAALVAATLLDWPWELALVIAYGPVLLWPAMWLVELGVRNVREAVFWSFGLTSAAKKHGWRYDVADRPGRSRFDRVGASSAHLVAGAYRGQSFELLDHEEVIDWDELLDSYRFATTTAVYLRDMGELPRARVTYDKRTGALRVDASPEVERALTDGAFVEWLIARWPGIPGFSTEPGTISAPFAEQNTPAFYRLLDFLVDLGARFPQRARRSVSGDSLES